MKLWKAWVFGYVVAILLGGLLGFLVYAWPPATGLAVFLYVVSLIATPVIASDKGRRWWLWLIIAIPIQVVPLFVVIMAESHGGRLYERRPVHPFGPL